MGCLHTERHCGADPCSLMIPMLIILVWINLCFSIFIMSKCGKSKLYCNRYIVFIFILKWMLSSLQPPFLTWLELFLHSSIPIMVISMFCQQFWWQWGQSWIRSSLSKPVWPHNGLSNFIMVSQSHENIWRAKKISLYGMDKCILVKDHTCTWISKGELVNM